jgi:hypothetical protein
MPEAKEMPIIQTAWNIPAYLVPDGHLSDIVAVFSKSPWKAPTSAHRE